MKPLLYILLFVLTSAFIEPVNNCERPNIYGRWTILTSSKGRLTNVDSLLTKVTKQFTTPDLIYKKSGHFEHSEGVSGEFTLDKHNCYLKEFIPSDKDTFIMEITYIDSLYLMLYDVTAKDRNRTFLYKRL